MEWIRYFRNDDEVPAVWFCMYETSGFQVLDLQQHELVWCDDYIADEYEIDGDEIIFASDNIVEVTELDFVEAVSQETPKSDQRLVTAIQCHYWGSNIVHHLHYGWTYEGEQISANWFQCPDEAGEWHVFYAKRAAEALFTQYVGEEWTTFEDELILIPANKLRSFDENGHRPGANHKNPGNHKKRKRHKKHRL